MVFKLVMAAHNTWRRLNGYGQLPRVIQSVIFTDGILADETQTRRHLIIPSLAFARSSRASLPEESVSRGRGPIHADGVRIRPSAPQGRPVILSPSTKPSRGSSFSPSTKSSASSFVAVRASLSAIERAAFRSRGIDSAECLGVARPRPSVLAHKPVRGESRHERRPIRRRMQLRGT